jgi:hypothetical protein
MSLPHDLGTKFPIHECWGYDQTGVELHTDRCQNYNCGTCLPALSSNSFSCELLIDKIS